MTVTLNAEQLNAAQAETRGMMRTALGMPDLKPDEGEAPFTVELLDLYLGGPRCEHLAARPVQPWLLTLPWTDWLCRRCTGERARQMQQRGAGLSAVEEFTCDRCREYAGPGNLTPALLRQDIWTIVCSLCPGCIEAAKAGGGRVTGENPLSATQAHDRGSPRGRGRTQRRGKRGTSRGRRR